MSFERLEVECRVITPMFSRGAQQSSSGQYPFELRPQSIKGVLRFWFRAVAPLVINVYELDVDGLPEKEKKKWRNVKYKGLKFLEGLIFGSQERRAPFGLMVNPFDRVQTKSLGQIEIEYKVKFKNQLIKSMGSGNLITTYDYIFYGLYDTPKMTVSEKGTVSKYLPQDSILTLTFFFHDPKVKEIILSLLQLISIFSGFGAKTRKGFGGFEIVNPQGYQRSVEKYKDVIEKVTKMIKEFIEEHNRKSDVPKLVLGRTNFNGLPEFPSFTHCKVFKLDNLADSAPTEVFKRLYKIQIDKQKRKVVERGWYPELKHKLRRLNGDCVEDLKNALLKGSHQITIPPSILGLPLQYQNLQDKNNPNLFRGIKVILYSSLEEVEQMRNDEIEGRKASPLFISIHKFSDGWKPIVLILESKITSKANLGLEKDVQTMGAISKVFEVIGFENYEKLEKIIEKEMGGVCI
ncbi:CRISPR-associated protein Cmr1 [Pseudothermotoga hypogea DSM 11164 = NBRC 106472]|uniref:CRISPR-associated protein Cmr1 n=1 Tax=Pseudothermotoga hypogea DSM 11164 = NBRC 106472 TaxID=1123384 RepID=A0A0X1KQZ9_9THEM|nr:type III-B CRISPR module RAMP protein Cmr1 [Pseudothermotoga hypogea]AJC73735.1 CRISPR-associated protein Cmr1 [Pseudothermotoga hypogea DSM 11164 = NBRC 106472]